MKTRRAVWLALPLALFGAGLIGFVFLGFGDNLAAGTAICGQSIDYMQSSLVALGVGASSLILAVGIFRRWSRLTLFVQLALCWLLVAALALGWAPYVPDCPIID